MHEKWKKEKTFIPRGKVLSGWNITYSNAVYDYLPRKNYPYCIRLTIGSDNIPYPSDSGSPAATLLEAKIIFNIDISTPGSRFIGAFIKDYFLCSPMECFEYIKIPLCWIPEEIRTQYNL